jgi:2-dehydropantoate 2-reductase
VTVELHPDYLTETWRKLPDECGGGADGAHRPEVRHVRRDDVADLARRYVAECLAVAQAEGAHLGDDVIDGIPAIFAGVGEDMTTSILTDRAAGRPLEWDIRNGVILRKAREHGLPAPISEVVVPLLAAAGDGPG